MKYRTLGRSGLKVSVLTMGTFTFGGKGPFAMVGNQGVAEARRLIDVCIEGGINLFDTSNMYSNGLSEEILGEALGGAPGRRADFVQGPHADRRRPQRRGRVALSPDPRMREEPQAAQDRRHRHLLHARVGRHDAAGRDAGRAGHPRDPGQDPLHRMLELFGLACHEGARGERHAALPAFRDPADPLYAGGPRGRIRAAADLGRPGPWCAGLESAGRRAALGQAPPQPGRPRKAHASSRAGPSRRSATRRSCGGSWMCSSTSQTPGACRAPRSRSPGCSAVRPSAHWWSAGGTRCSSRTTWLPSTSN